MRTSDTIGPPRIFQSNLSRTVEDLLGVYQQYFTKGSYWKLYDQYAQEHNTFTCLLRVTNNTEEDITYERWSEAIGFTSENSFSYVKVSCPIEQADPSYYIEITEEEWLEMLLLL